MNDNTENTENLPQEEFDLEDILREFGSHTEEPSAEEPEQELPQEDAPAEPASPAEPAPEQGEEGLPAEIPAPEDEALPEEPDFGEEMPELFPQKEEAPDEDGELPHIPVQQEAPAINDQALEGNTVRFDPITDEQAAASLAAMAQQAAEQEGQGTQEEAPKAAPEPAFEVEEEFIPSPSLFTSHSRLRELKKKLVAGPEKRYYELSEVGTARLQAAIFLSVLIAALSAAVAVLSAAGAIGENRLKLVIFSQILGMLLSALMGVYLMLDSIGDLFRGKFTVNTLVTITFAACMADAVFCLQELRIPCCCAFSLEMAMALWGRYHQRTTEMAELDTMRKAVRLHGLVRKAKYYNGRDGLLRTEGEVEDFMDTYQKSAGPQRVQSVYAALSLLACIAIAVFAGLRSGISMGVQIFAASLLVALPASFFVSLTRPMAILEQRLHMVGTVLCGWQGVKGLRGKVAVPLYDQDLFPVGSTKLNGVKFYGDEDPVDVVSYTASLISVAGGGLMPVLQNLAKNRGSEIHSVENFQRYGGGGIGGEVQGMPVLLGTLNFVQDMGVEVPEGTMVNQAVYAAIDGQLGAVYAISYAKMRSAAAGLVTLCGAGRVTPVLLCGDFMLTESFLRAKFSVKTKRIAFPTREEAVQLLKTQPDPDAPVLALTTREELVSTAYAISGARALRTADRLGLFIHILGGVLGLLIMLALAILGNTELLTPTNLLLYQLVWGVPGLLVTEWTRIL